MLPHDRPDLDASTVAGTRTGPRPALEAVPALTVVAHPDLERVGARVLLRPWPRVGGWSSPG